MNRRIHFWGIVCGSLLAVVEPPPAQALFIDPLRMEVTAPTGAIHTLYIRVSNDAPQAVIVESGFYHDTPQQGEWIRAAEGRWELDAGAVTSLPYRLEIPAEATGEYRGRAFFEEAEARDAGATRLAARLAVPIYILVRGTQTMAAEIQSLQVLGTSPLCVAVTVFNGGNQHIRPQGTLRLSSDAAGSKSLELGINPAAEPVFPLSSEALMARSNGATLPSGNYEAQVELQVHGQTFTHRAALRIP